MQYDLVRSPFNFDLSGPEVKVEVDLWISARLTSHRLFSEEIKAEGDMGKGFHLSKY